jgi:hypothetical protein
MNVQSRAPYLRAAVRVAAGVAGFVAAGYATFAGLTWLRYGRVADANPAFADPLLDRYMPAYEVVERHEVHINAPAPIVLATAREQDLMGLPLVRAIFKTRELLMGAAPPRRDPVPNGLLAEMLSLGWGVLAEVPDREVVVGSVTRPWEANVIFTALPHDTFAAFAEPGFVKIAWSLRADPIGADRCVFRTETRAIATDHVARARFRRYWAFVSPGVALIRRLSLAPLKNKAEQRARVEAASDAASPGVLAFAPSAGDELRVVGSRAGVPKGMASQRRTFTSVPYDSDYGTSTGCRSGGAG